MSPSVFVFIALNCEAKPLIRHWRLKKHPGKHPFAIYTSDERVVVVSGIGKVAMAGAVGYTLSLFPDIQQPLLLNLGIAGHRQHNLGSLYLADKIIDKDSGKKFYPQLPFSAHCQTLTVSTQAKPHADYAEDCLYDMEAAAFYEMAIKFSSGELIHCLKIVSDNSQSPLENISEALVEDWCGRHLITVDQLLIEINRIRKLTRTTQEQYEQLLDQFHFSATSAARLKALLARWRLLMTVDISGWRQAEPRNGKELIAWLEKQLETVEFYL